MNIVSASVPYSYSILTKHIATLKKLFPFIQISIIGKSVLGKNIYSLRLGIRP